MDRFFRHAACGGEEERSLGDTPKPPPGAAPLDPASQKARCLYETEKAMKIAYFVQERE